jgi:hypothetical protein
MDLKIYSLERNPRLWLDSWQSFKTFAIIISVDSISPQLVQGQPLTMPSRTRKILVLAVTITEMSMELKISSLFMYLSYFRILLLWSLRRIVAWCSPSFATTREFARFAVRVGSCRWDLAERLERLTVSAMLSLLHLPPLRFLRVGRFWDRTQDWWESET